MVLEGRDDELETLHAALLRARRSALQLIWISGEAGVGKTALAVQLRQPAERSGGRFAMGKCEQFGGGAPLQAPRQAIAQLLAELSAGPEEARLALAGMLRKALGPDAGALLPLLPELGTITGPLPEPVALEPHEQPQRLLHLIKGLLGTLTRQVRPLLLVLDDLQWADPLTLELIPALLDDPGLHGLLLLALFRHTDVTPGTALALLLEQTAVRPLPPLRLALANLSREHVERLLVRRLRSEPDALASLRDAILLSTEGNPFFVHQLVNALQREELLHQDSTGAWHWREEPLRQRLANGDVVAFLSGCLLQLPPASLEVLACLGWLGSQANLELLAVASGQTLSQLPALLMPALAQGVLVCSQASHLAIADPSTVVGFGHDHLQQAVTNLAEAHHQAALQLAMARRLSAAGHHVLAAQHFAATTSLLSTPEECSQVIRVLQQAGHEALEQGDLHAAEHFLKQSLALLGPEPWQRHPDITWDLQRGLHQLAYCHADYDQADAIYAELLQRSSFPKQLLEPAAIQVMALSNRGHYQRAVDLGADLLRILGCHIPLGNPQLALGQELDAVNALIARGGLEMLPPLPARLAAEGNVSTLLNRLVPAAFFCDPTLACWLVLNSSRQWLAGDAHPARLYPLACTLLATVPASNDYTTGYRAARTALTVGEASPYQAETARTRHVFSLLCQHWFEPLEQALAQARRAHEDQQRCRDLEFACYTFFTTQAAVLECGQDLAQLAEENGRAVAFARRTGNRHAEPAFTAFTWLLNTLQGIPAGNGTDQCIEPGEHSDLNQANPMAACYHHVYRGLVAALLSDVPCLQHHAEAASRLEPFITGFYPVALIHLLQGLALVQQLREGPDASVSAALQDQQIWWTSRAADARQNFAHLAALLEAERLAALGQGLEALETYERSLRDAIAHQRP